jgi:hypothetical protein
MIKELERNNLSYFESIKQEIEAVRERKSPKNELIIDASYLIF